MHSLFLKPPRQRGLFWWSVSPRLANDPPHSKPTSAVIRGSETRRRRRKSFAQFFSACSRSQANIRSTIAPFLLSNLPLSITQLDRELNHHLQSLKPSDSTPITLVTMTTANILELDNLSTTPIRSVWYVVVVVDDPSSSLLHN